MSVIVAVRLSRTSRYIPIDLCLKHYVLTHHFFPPIHSIITHSFSDKEEMVAGTNPKDPNDVPPDGVVGANGKSAAVTAALLLDSDADGIVDTIEQEDGTDRFNPDSDGDGASDAEEKQAGTDPLDPSDTPAFEDANGNGKVMRLTPPWQKTVTETM